MQADEIWIGVATLVGAAGLYLLLAGEVSWAEALAAVPVVALGLFYMAALLKNRSLPLRLQRRAFAALASGTASIVPETAVVAWGLLAAVRGRPEPAHDGVVRQPFRRGGGDPGDVGRRAAVVAGLSLAPNGFVLDIGDETDGDCGELLIHHLVPAPVSRDREWPV